MKKLILSFVFVFSTLFSLTSQPLEPWDLSNEGLADLAYSGAISDTFNDGSWYHIAVGVRNTNCTGGGDNREAILTIYNHIFEIEAVGNMEWNSSTIFTTTPAQFRFFRDIKKIGDNKFIVIGMADTDTGNRPGVFTFELIKEFGVPKISSVEVNTNINGSLKPNLSCAGIGINTACEGFVATCQYQDQGYIVKLNDDLSPSWAGEINSECRYSKAAVEIPIQYDANQPCKLGYALVGEYVDVTTNQYNNARGVYLSIFEDPESDVLEEVAAIDNVVYHTREAHQPSLALYESLTALTKTKSIAVSGDGQFLGLGGIHSEPVYNEETEKFNVLPGEFLLVTLELPITSLTPPGSVLNDVPGNNFSTHNYYSYGNGGANYAQSIIGHSKGGFVLAGRTGNNDETTMSALYVSSHGNAGNFVYKNAPIPNSYISNVQQDNGWADVALGVAELSNGKVALFGSANSEICCRVFQNDDDENEFDCCLNVCPINESRATQNDTDGDLVLNSVEVMEGTDPDDHTDFLDSDGDGVPDAVEIDNNTDPNDSTSFQDNNPANDIPDYTDSSCSSQSVTKFGITTDTYVVQANVGQSAGTINEVCNFCDDCGELDATFDYTAPYGRCTNYKAHLYHLVPNQNYQLFEWVIKDGNDNVINTLNSGDATPVISFGGPGIYSVTLSLSEGEGCNWSEYTMDVVIPKCIKKRSEVNESNGPSQTDVNIYPNPTNGLVNITADLPIENLEIYNIYGQAIKVPFQRANSTLQLDLSSENNGIYFIRLHINGAVFTKRIESIK